MSFNLYNYFDEEYDRPDVTTISLIAKDVDSGVLFDYVTTSYLNAYINHVDVIDAYGVNRVDYDKDINTEALSVMHPNLSDYRDHVMILGRSPNKNNSYFFFFYSINGGSNSMIGNFITDDNESVVLNHFINACNQLNAWYNNDDYNPEEYPIIKLPKLNGWIKG